MRVPRAACRGITFDAVGSMGARYRWTGSSDWSFDDEISRGEDGGLSLVARQASKAWIVDRDDLITERVWDAARLCHTALGCRDYSLFDFRIDPDGQPWFLEAGLYCSFARQSVVSVMAEAAGIPLDELFAAAVRAAMSR